LEARSAEEAGAYRIAVLVLSPKSADRIKWTLPPNNEADVELNVLYRQITASLNDDEATTELPVAAQRAWVAFRDAECAFSASGVAAAPPME
jgi:hypothetical protein